MTVTILHFTEQNIDKTVTLGTAQFTDNKLDHIVYDDIQQEFYVIGHGSFFDGLICEKYDSIETFLIVCDSMCNIVYNVIEIDVKDRF